MAAGSWLTGAGIGDANIAVGARTIQVALHESVKNKTIMGHPVIRELMSQDAALGQLLGELGVSLSLAAVGQGKLEAKAEGTAATATNFSASNIATVTPARRAYARKVSDLARSVQEGLLRGELSPNAVALMVYDAFGCWCNDLVDRIVAFATSATYEMGLTGTDLTWDDIQDGVLDAQNRGVVGNGLGLVDAKGAKDIGGNSLTLGGAIQMREATQQWVSDSRKGAYIGTEWGVDWYLNSELDADGADTMGIVLWPGALLLKSQRVPLPAEAQIIADLGFLTIEGSRPGGGLTEAEYVAHNAVGIREAARFDGIRYVT